MGTGSFFFFPLQESTDSKLCHGVEETDEPQKSLREMRRLMTGKTVSDSKKLT